MSTENKDNKKNDPKTDDKQTQSTSNDQGTQKTKVDVHIDRSPELAKLQEELETAKREKEAINEKYEQADAEKKQVSEERDRYKGTISQIAIEKFNAEKNDLVEKVKIARGEDASKKLAEIIGDDPKKLETIKSTVSNLGEMLFTANKENKEAEKKDEKKVDTFNPPRSNATLPPSTSSGSPNTYETYREMVNELYRKTALGDKTAAKALEDLWNKAIPELKGKLRSVAFSISQCPHCKLGFDGNKCPSCGWTPTQFEERG